MITAVLFLGLLQILPLGTPEDALASMAQLELQLAELKKLMDQNIALSKDNRENLAALVDELVASADAALVNLQASRAAHGDLVQLSRDGVPSDSDQNYVTEFQKRVEKSNEVDSATAEALQEIAQRSTKSSQYAAVSAQANVQVWQTLNRISLQLQELTSLMRKSSSGPTQLNRIQDVYSNIKKSGNKRGSN